MAFDLELGAAMLSSGSATGSGRPPHPGLILREEVLDPLGLSAHALAMALRIPATRISEIVRERRGITADTALRLGLYFGRPPQYWMRLQVEFDLWGAAQDRESALRAEIHPHPQLAVLIQKDFL